MYLYEQLKKWRPFINDRLRDSVNIIEVKSGLALEVGPSKGNPEQDSRYKNNPIYDFYKNFEIKTGCLNTEWADYKIDITNPETISDDLKNKFDLIFLLEVAEHTEKPWNIKLGLDKLLKSGGFVLVSTPCFVNAHSNNFYGDYWRFLPESHNVLFENFDVVSRFVCNSEYGFPYGVFSILKKK